MRWQWLMMSSVAVTLGVVGLSAQAASTTPTLAQRGPIQSTTLKPVETTGAATLMTLSGSAKKLKLTPVSTLNGATPTIWIKLAQTTVTQNGQKTRYFEVRNPKTGVTGWLPVSQVVASTRGQMSVRKPQTPTIEQVTATTPIYRLQGSLSRVQPTVIGHLTSGMTPTVVATRTVTLAGKSQQYDELRQHGWVLATALSPYQNGATTKGKTVHGVTTYHVKGNALQPTSGQPMQWLPLVGNGRYTTGKMVYRPTRGYLKNVLQTTPDTLTQTAGYLAHDNFRTTFYLPTVTYHGLSLSDPQSAAFSKDNHYLYVMYVDGAESPTASQSGWVVRYDWQRLMQLGAAKAGHMAMIRQAVLAADSHHVTAKDRQVLACLTLGPKFDSGHAQSLSLNPVTNELWFVQASGKQQPNVVERLNPTTLRPDAAVDFKLSATAGMGDVLTFDDQGNAYFWTHGADSATDQPLGGVKLYRGKISTKAVRFQLIDQGLKSRPGLMAQSISYDDVTKDLYLISDDSITTVPVAKLGHLTTGEVGESNYRAQREFEGLVFMHHSSNGYLLTNRGVELMKLNG
ncbi:hypothetical protein ACFP1L_04810 [Lactiplantibacillus nangangensis]|uniref:Extracellular protein n=1 Tax=Lactiplantibacillus nangangensis TaxID=2559917 RepID=A0ABW1SI56_9LACO|nr:hypothetical protein [Lactiplantibacillus nangangensis]